ncbi:MAG: hypothetical protein CMJ31_02735 [Phycisphaerae bacterium]|nr:hypothetical protein [Phycisphaerae bacterium]
MPAPPPESIDAYLDSLAPDRREAIEAVRGVIRANLPEGYEEGIQYRMIGYYVPHRLYAPGYHCDPKQPLPFASLASQKNHMALYLFCTYASEDEASWFRDKWTSTGKPLDMGKGCVRFKRLVDVPLEVVGECVRRVPVATFIETYEANLPPKIREKHMKLKARLEGDSEAPTMTMVETPAAPVAKKTRKKAAKKAGAKKAAKKTAKKATKKTAKKATKKTAKKATKKTAKKAAKKVGKKAATKKMTKKPPRRTTKRA